MENQVEEKIEEIAIRIVEKKLSTVAILFLEMHKPIAFIASQAVAISTPLLGMLFGYKRMEDYYNLLSSKENIELLISKIEELERAKK